MKLLLLAALCMVSACQAVTYTKIVPGKHISATQSSTGWSGSATRAVDGNTSGNYNDGSCTHTQSESSPEWSVTLESNLMIKRVKLYNRADCCADRLRDLKVYVGTQLCGNFTGPGVAGQIVTIDCPGRGLRGNLLKVKKTTQGYLTLCEVEGYTTNIGTLGSSVDMSPYGWGGVAQRAVDGNTNNNYNQQSCTHTLSVPQPYFTVTYASPVTVSRVIITNRKDCCEDRLRDIVVTVGETLCGCLAGPAAADVDSYEIDCGRAISGSSVTVKKTSTGYLTICELEVYET